MMTKLLKKIGPVGLLILITVLAISYSLIVGFIICMSIWGSFPQNIIVCCIVVPALSCPIVAYFFVIKVLYQLFEAEEKLRNLSMRDPLTGVFNRRHFLERLEGEVARNKQFGDQFSLVMLDIDDFKRINDTYGHSAGDKVLMELAETCSRSIREVDLFARYGGEEFILLLPKTKVIGAEICAERLRQSLAESAVVFQAEKISFTVSAGITAAIDFKEGSIDDIIVHVDKALYQAKNEGKNCTRIFDAK